MNHLTNMVNQFEPTFAVMTPRRAMACTVLCSLLVLVAGCQSIGQQVDEITERGWVETRQTVSRIAHALRPAPRDETIFASADWVSAYRSGRSDTGDAALNTHLLEQRAWVKGLGAGVPVLQREAVNRTLDNGVTVYRPGRGRSVVRTPPRRPAFAPPTPVTSPGRPASIPGDPFAYVRLGGPSDMRDWQLCEARVGGAFIVAQSGTTIAPDFDACMRARGYLPEAEAERRLQRQPKWMTELAGGSSREAMSGLSGLRGAFRP